MNQTGSKRTIKKERCADWQHHIHTDLDSFEQASRLFFKWFGTRKLLGNSFFDALDADLESSLTHPFDLLLARCGYANRFDKFFDAVMDQIFDPAKKQVSLNGIIIPNLYLYELLSAVFPGENLHTIHTPKELLKKAFIPVSKADALQQVMDLYPVRLSDHVIRQALISEGVARQYLPKADELDDTGHDITFDGHFKHGLLEQMYQNRVVFLLDMRCPVYCRFCFRKHKSNRKEKTPATEDVKRAVDHVASHRAITEILITGGEPLLNPACLDEAVTGLEKIDHVRTIRIATRSIAYYPHLFLKNDRALIKDLIEKNRSCRQQGKTIELGIHLVHPDEISIQCLTIISELVKNGIRVYVQTPYLKGVNTSGKTLGELFIQLRQAGAQIYYIFAPCSPIHGTRQYWAPICDAIKAARYLREHLSDRCMPKLCTATPLGKIEWHTSGWAVEKDEKDPSYTWIRTPYSKAYFHQFLRTDDTDRPLKSNPLPDYRVNYENTLDAKFRVDMGVDTLLMGVRPEQRGFYEKSEPDRIDSRAMLLDVRKKIAGTNLFRTATIPVPSDNVRRFHRASVEITHMAGNQEIAYIRDQLDITDVIITCHLDDSFVFDTLETMVAFLKAIDHIVCVRLCFSDLVIKPGRLTEDQIQQIAAWSDFSVSNPFRIEVELWALLPDLDKDIGKIAHDLVGKGVNVYANVPLIKGINDEPAVMVTLAHQLRENAIEFHHLYVSGLEFQQEIEQQFGLGRIDTQILIDLASMVRTDCSGRQIPLYIVQTPEGEKDLDIFNWNRETQTSSHTSAAGN